MKKKTFCVKKWERTYLTKDSDTSYADNWIFEREFFKDKIYIMHITRLGDPGEEDEYATYTTAWRWYSNDFSTIEIQSNSNNEEWHISRLPKLTETDLILEQDRDNNELFRFHFRAE